MQPANTPWRAHERTLDRASFSSKSLRNGRDEARGEEIFVSDLTRQLATGAGFTFEDRGEVELRGVTGSRRIFLLEAPPTREPTYCCGC